MKTHVVSQEVLNDLYQNVYNVDDLLPSTQKLMKTILSPSYSDLVNGRLYLVNGEVARLKSKQNVGGVEVCIFQKHSGKPFAVEATDVEYADAKQVGKYLGGY